MTHRQPAALGEEIAFLGYDLEPTALSPGDEVRLTLYWRAESRIRKSYLVFSHLLDADGVVRGQSDAVPRGGRYPTDQWQGGETIIDRHVLTLAQDAPPGIYRIEIGLYDPADGARLPLSVAGQRQPDDRLLLDIVVQGGM